MSEGIDWASLRTSADKATKPLPKADYRIQVTKSELTKAQSSGADMIKVNLTVVEGEWASRILFNNFVFSPEKAFALKMWFDNLGAFGLDDAFFAQGPSLSQVAMALLERFAIVSVDQREWPAGSGTMRNECVGFKPITGAAAVRMPSAVAAGAAVIPSPSVAPSGAVPPVPKVAAGTSTPPTPNF